MQGKEEEEEGERRRLRSGFGLPFGVMNSASAVSRRTRCTALPALGLADALHDRSGRGRRPHCRNSGRRVGAVV